MHEWIQKRAKSLDAITGGSVAFALFSRTIRAEVSVGGVAGISQNELKAEFEPAVLGMDGKGIDVTRLVTSGLFGHIEDRVTIEAMNVAVIDVARQFGVLDKLPCVIVMDGFPTAGGETKLFDVIELSGREMTGFDKALQVATAQFERHPNYAVYVEKIRCLHEGASQLAGLDQQLKLTPPKEEQAKRVLLDALKRGNWESFSALVSPVIGNQSADELRDLCREDFGRLFQMHSTVSGVADWKTLIWPLEDRELRYVRGPLEQVSDLLRELELTDRFPLAFKVKSAFEKWYNEFCSAWGRITRQSLDKIEARLGSQVLKGVYASISSKGISDRRDQLLKSIAKDIDDLSRMQDQPSWRSCFDAALNGTGKHIPAEARHVADWLQGSGMLAHFIKGLSKGDASKILEQIAKTHGSDAFLRKPRVFLSYSRADEKVVMERLPFLRLTRAEVFRDKDNIESGEPWKERLREEITKCDFLALFWSWSAAKSEYVREEYLHALEIGKEIRPLVLTPPPPDIPKELGHINFLQPFGAVGP